MKKALLALVVLGQMVFAAPSPRTGFDWSVISSIAIQDRGRIKPLETWAQETLLYVTGKRSWKGMPATEVMFGWLIAFDKEWQGEQFIKISYKPLKKQLGLDEDRSFFSPQEVEGNTELQKIMKEAMAKESRKERLDQLEKMAGQLQNQKGLIESVLSGRSWDILPNPEGQQLDWPNLASLGDRAEPIPYSQDEIVEFSDKIKAVIEAFTKNDANAFNQAAVSFAGFLRGPIAKGHYPSASELSREKHYNNLRPFRWSWILYAAAFVLLLWHVNAPTKLNRILGIGTLIAGFGIHTYGFILRMLIAGRPPVTNMYESVIWVSWGCVLFSFFIWMAYKNANIPTAATVFSVVSLVLADTLPSVLDPSINPLEPVLRSNFWLTIHVLTITLSYAAFALSLCLGNVVLGNYLFRPKATELIQNYSLYMYRSVQIGVVLLAAGTILGGVWADYSWGRFWGWDPKEVWALIALLLYLAVLHGRFSGWLKGFGFVTSTVVAFLGVLMAWYGVNFVLGVGLHSYGFGTGGTEYVFYYVALQLAFVGAAYARYKKARATMESEPAIFPKR